MPFYKFLKSEHLESLMSGHILLGSLGRYREEENRQIRDETDGIQNYHQSEALHYDGLKNAGSSVQRQLAALRIPASGTDQVVAINNAVTAIHLPSHLFCFSSGEIEPLKEHWRTSYNCCVEINDPVALGYALHTVAWPLYSPSENARDLFKLIGTSEVTYDGGTIDVVQHSTPPMPSIFSKSPDHVDDQEWRIAFSDKRTLPRNVFLYLKNASNFFFNPIKF